MHDAFKHMHGGCPITRSSHYGGFHVLARHADVVEAAKNPEVFSSAKTPLLPWPEGQVFIPLTIDPPALQKYRRMIFGLMQAQALHKHEGAIRSLAEECLNKKVPVGQLDVVTDLAQPLTAITALKIIGLSPEKWRAYAEPGYDFTYGRIPYDEALRRLHAMHESAFEDVEQVRKNPVPGTLLEALFDAEIDGRKLTQEEICNYTMELLGGGLDTTQAAIGSAVVYLGRTPEARRRLIENPSLIPSAVEEFLRAFAPAQGSGRTLTRDYTLNGTALKKGDTVFLSWAASNLDPKVFEAPNEVNLARERNRHLAFGFGPHQCMGMHLARMEINICLAVLLERVPEFILREEDIHLAKDCGWVYGYESVPIQF